MAGLNAAHRNHYFLQEAERTGIHQPILAALYRVHQQPQLNDGEVGLGIAPANRIALEQVSTFPEQVQFAANTIRSLTDKLVAQGWKGEEFWEPTQGRYSDRFLGAIANGYNPPANDLVAARLEACDRPTLIQAYLDSLVIEQSASSDTEHAPSTVAYLDGALQQFVEHITRHYVGLSYQREALLEALRIWRKLDSRPAIVASLLSSSQSESQSNQSDSREGNGEDRTLDDRLIQAVQPLSSSFAGYPHQREALIRLVQRWRQLPSRRAAILSLSTNTAAEVEICTIDSALIAFAQSVSRRYRGQGEQRYALTETYRVWHELESRTLVLKELGIDAQVLTASNPDQAALIDAAAQIDRALLEFIRRTPVKFAATQSQREALIRLVQLWQGLDDRSGAIQELLEQVRRMETAHRTSPDAPFAPQPIALPPRPVTWTPENIQLHAAIVPNGSFTWAEATQGGKHAPPNLATVEAIERMAKAAQHACDRIHRPFQILRWYDASKVSPNANQRMVGALDRRHELGDAIEFYCDGLTGNQIYYALDPWWPGGLGRYTQYPLLCYLDCRRDRVRWTW
jgi:hypothetical protein